MLNEVSIMGLGGISPWSLLLILAIVLLLFGTKKLKGLGGDLGGAIKGFKKAITDEDDKKIAQEESETVDMNVDNQANAQEAEENLKK